ncbi:hypothetical protein BDZ89DRAFT_948728, partial [Hymenopellis radicata]
MSTFVNQPVALFGCFFGATSAYNVVARVDGDQSRKRALLAAVLTALYRAPESRHVHILVNDKNTVKLVVDKAREFRDRSWNVPDGDLLQLINQIINARAGRVIFEYLDKGGA